MFGIVYGKCPNCKHSSVPLVLEISSGYHFRCTSCKATSDYACKVYCEECDGNTRVSSKEVEDEDVCIDSSYDPDTRYELVCDAGHVLFSYVDYFNP